MLRNLPKNPGLNYRLVYNSFTLNKFAVKGKEGSLIPTSN